MQPMGRKKIKFPGKTSQWLGKGLEWWWEDCRKVSKKTERQAAKREIRKES